MGLGFVLSFGYWCTDFLVIQRAMAADSEASARRVPLIAAIPKMFFPFLVILPGLIAVSVTSHMPGAGARSTLLAHADGRILFHLTNSIHMASSRRRRIH